MIWIINVFSQGLVDTKCVVYISLVNVPLPLPNTKFQTNRVNPSTIEPRKEFPTMSSP
jgi:hypothetical protein